MRTRNKRHSIALGHLASAYGSNRLDFQIGRSEVLCEILSGYTDMRRNFPHGKTLDPLGDCDRRRSTLTTCVKPCIQLPIPQT
jgi:hypothetical protein